MHNMDKPRKEDVKLKKAKAKDNICVIAFFWNSRKGKFRVRMQISDCLREEVGKGITYKHAQ